MTVIIGTYFTHCKISLSNYYFTYYFTISDCNSFVWVYPLTALFVCLIYFNLSFVFDYFFVCLLKLILAKKNIFSFFSDQPRELMNWLICRWPVDEVTKLWFFIKCRSKPFRPADGRATLPSTVTFGEKRLSPSITAKQQKKKKNQLVGWNKNLLMKVFYTHTISHVEKVYVFKMYHLF